MRTIPALLYKNDAHGVVIGVVAELPAVLKGVRDGSFYGPGVLPEVIAAGNDYKILARHSSGTFTGLLRQKYPGFNFLIFYFLNHP